MSDARHVVLIHGTWARGDGWGPTRTAFEERGYSVHTPTLRHHELSMQDGATKIAPLSMRDYTDDLVALVDSLESPPLLVGLSMGGLLAQLVAKTAAQYQRGTVVEIPEADHLVFFGDALPVTIDRIDEWMAGNHVLADGSP
ncbi:hypothetical protein A5765_16500 [Mycolicibacterium celeriflavum]|uniref:alpha/beta hydrolase n=1 Tax=Mycolicibacterium celeriflavum TaxID=1249101 RepID=UPI0007FD23DB|nr:alpha/beta hydrolase [Mycolicibacterium celeriflavum]OBG11712.1 hypothetical protein A5765_16500 [Mycolicibacterium celeriflavum]